ncbi:MAG: hypothetical protein JO119_08615 [Acidobacteria bacterium]|nr:hypothetical protein [Acidobacteriota bacterium]
MDAVFNGRVSSQVLATSRRIVYGSFDASFAHNPLSSFLISLESAAKFRWEQGRNNQG